MEQERGANMDTRETMFLFICRGMKTGRWNFFIGYFFQSVRPRMVTTSLKVYSLKLLHGNNSSIKTCIFVNNAVVTILQVN